MLYGRSCNLFSVVGKCFAGVASKLLIVAIIYTVMVDYLKHDPSAVLLWRAGWQPYVATGALVVLLLTFVLLWQRLWLYIPMLEVTAEIAGCIARNACGGLAALLTYACFESGNGAFGVLSAPFYICLMVIEALGDPYAI